MQEHQGERKQRRNILNYHKTRVFLLGTLYTPQSHQLGSATSTEMSFHKLFLTCSLLMHTPTSLQNAQAEKKDNNKKNKNFLPIWHYFTPLVFQQS